MACGLAAESGEPVVLSCTGATASRNYLPGLTEAFYRKLPVLAITSTQYEGRVGHHIPQVIDRSRPLNDIVHVSVSLPAVRDEEEAWSCEINANKAILVVQETGFRNFLKVKLPFSSVPIRNGLRSRPRRSIDSARRTMPSFSAIIRVITKGDTGFFIRWCRIKRCLQPKPTASIC